MCSGRRRPRRSRAVPRTSKIVGEVGIEADVERDVDFLCSP